MFHCDVRQRPAGQEKREVASRPRRTVPEWCFMWKPDSDKSSHGVAEIHANTIVEGNRGGEKGNVCLNALRAQYVGARFEHNYLITVTTFVRTVNVHA